MESEIRKYPKVIVGVFIFNEKGELFLMKTVQWKNKYTVPGGKVGIGEKLAEAAKREIKEETNLDIYDVKFLNIFDALDIADYTLDEEHLIFIDYSAKVKDIKNIKFTLSNFKSFDFFNRVLKVLTRVLFSFSTLVREK